MDEITNGFITLNAKSYFGTTRTTRRKGNFRVEDDGGWKRERERQVEEDGKCKERRERTVLINAR